MSKFVPFSVVFLPLGPVFDPGQIWAVTTVRMAQPGSGPWSPDWNLTVTHGSWEWSWTVKLRNGMATLENLLEAGAVFIPLPVQIHPREFLYSERMVSMPLFF
jgi:hypothetical protein